MRKLLSIGLMFLAGSGKAGGADYPAPTPGNFVIKNFRFASGAMLPEARIHYRALGKRQLGAKGLVRNAVLILHGTGGSGDQFVSGMGRRWFASELFGKGQPLDATRYYLIIPDNLGHGKSSKPSDGLRARFPHYGYRDMIEAQYRLLTEHLKVNHLRLVMGTSMGGMHTWLWGELHPEFMDALLPLASLPTQISGRNRMWRKTSIDAIRNDPEWRHGEYKTQPPSRAVAAHILVLFSRNPVLWQKAAPTLKKADEVLDQASAGWRRADTNDLLYALESSWDYDPGPGLEKIQVPLLAINSADDLINPAELGILEKEIGRVKHGRAVLLPYSAQTVGHGTHTKAAVWKDYLAKLLKESKH